MNLDSSRRALRTQLRETARLQILDAAEHLIATRGLHGAGIAQIARRAGIAVGTVYNYFTDRDALVRALFEWRRTTMRPQLLAVAADARRLAFEPRLRAFVRGVLATFDAHRRFIKVAIETEHLKPPGSTTATDLATAIDDIFAAGVAERMVSAKHAPLAPLLLQGSIRAIVLRRTHDASSLVDAADGLVDMVLDGVRRRSK